MANENEDFWFIKKAKKLKLLPQLKKELGDLDNKYIMEILENIEWKDILIPSAVEALYKYIKKLEIK
jgi:hypothetical protein